MIATARESLVYRFQSGELLKSVDKDVQWKILERKDLRIFSPNSFLIRRSCIESFRKKHWCVILYNDVDWIAYGWVRPPFTAAPPHLPCWFRNREEYWLYTAHTNNKYRRMGYNKYLKKIRIDLIRENKNAKRISIYTDTVAVNIPSRRSMLSSGFEPEGIITRYYIKELKYLNYLLYRNRWGFVWGTWNKLREHPPLPDGS